MNFVSTKQISELWGITTRRIVQYAVQGRIPGAKQIDGRWFIPENASKPIDPRKKRKALKQQSEDRYIFPYPLSIIYSDEQKDGLTEEEKELYRLDLLYEKGSFAEARELAEQLLSSHNRYIRLGALYILSTVCMYLSDFEAVEKYFVLFHTACQNQQEHRAELDLLSIELDGELVSFSRFSGFLDLSDTDKFPYELLPLIGACKLLAEIMRFKEKNVQTDISPYLILCRMTEAQGGFYYAMLMHLYLSSFYSLNGNREPAYMHMKKAVEIGLKHDTLFTVSYTLFYDPELASVIISELPAEAAERISKLSVIFSDARNAYAEYRGGKSVLSTLNKEDYKLLSCCMKKYSIDQMAESFDLTRSGINKRLSVLYGKFGVKSKNELIKEYFNAALEWERK